MFNLKLPLAFLWTLLGGAIILFPIAFPITPWWGILIWVVISTAFLGYADAVVKYLTKD